MNIFVLHTDATLAALHMDDVRVPKMIVESGQMLATALREHGMDDDALIHTGVVTLKGTPWRSTHRNHPCTVWARQTRSNYAWLAEHALALCLAYEDRFGKTHGSLPAIEAMCELAHIIPDGYMTPFPLAMPDEFKESDYRTDNPAFNIYDAQGAVISYRRYYSSKPNVRWTRRPDGAPSWWTGVSA